MIFRKKNILVLGKGPTQGLEHTLTAEKMNSINFTVTNKKFCLSLNYNGANSYLLVNGAETYKVTAKYSEILEELDLLVMFMILVLIRSLLQSMILKIFISI